LAERGEFELPVPICEQSDDSIRLGFATSRRTAKRYAEVQGSPKNPQLRIEYHPASDGPATKTPEDFVTVDLKSRKLVHFNATDLGRLAAARRITDQ
jgi:hypothetical protein